MMQTSHIIMNKFNYFHLVVNDLYDVVMGNVLGSLSAQI